MVFVGMVGEALWEGGWSPLFLDSWEDGWAPTYHDSWGDGWNHSSSCFWREECRWNPTCFHFWSCIYSLHIPLLCSLHNNISKLKLLKYFGFWDGWAKIF